jgi:GR25 family glycosyltransferase involved in LPS biosynthesis
MFKILGTELAQKGFFINLDKSTDRLERIKNQIEKFEIEGLERFAALTDSFIQFSCTKSHIQVFRESIENGLDVIAVFEDDMEILENPKTNNTSYDLKEFLPQIKSQLNNQDWDVLLLGCNPKSYLIPVSENLARNHFSTGGWGYIIKKRAMQYILDNSNYTKDYIAIDDWLPKLSNHGFDVLTTIPMVVHHGKSLESTLQPRGLVDYTAWIDGNYQNYLYRFQTPEKDLSTLVNEFQVEREVTIVIVGHFLDNYLYYLRHLLQSLPTEIERCKFLVIYDTKMGSKSSWELEQYFKNRNRPITWEVVTSRTGITDSMKIALEKVQTPYFIFLEHDWVFLQKNRIEFKKLVETMNKYSFVNAVWFNKDDNQLRGFEICGDKNGMVTPYEKELRIDEIDLVTTIRWSNNPVIFRTSKMKEWFDSYVDNPTIGISHQGQYNLEDNMIRVYRETIEKNDWNEIKDQWGTYLYGNIGEGQLVGHTDASRRYQTNIRTMAEDNADEYVKNNSLPSQD